jgi:phosphoglycolate phosphatase-like HAD superfamily hydrolase
MEEIELVAFASRGTLLDWSGAIEAVAYELARRNGESPLDRGASLRRRVEELADGHGLARGFERLARERGYRDESGEESLARVVSLARPLPGAREAVAAAAASGKRVIAVSRGEVPGALYLFGAAIEAVVTELDPDQLGVPPKKILYVSASAARRAEAVLRGMRAVAPRGVAGALALSSELEPVAA